MYPSPAPEAFASVNCVAAGINCSVALMSSSKSGSRTKKQSASCVTVGMTPRVRGRVLRLECIALQLGLVVMNMMDTFALDSPLPYCANTKNNSVFESERLRTMQLQACSSRIWSAICFSSSTSEWTFSRVRSNRAESYHSDRRHGDRTASIPRST